MKALLIFIICLITGTIYAQDLYMGIVTDFEAYEYVKDSNGETRLVNTDATLFQSFSWIDSTVFVFTEINHEYHELCYYENSTYVGGIQSDCTYIATLHCEFNIYFDIKNCVTETSYIIVPKSIYFKKIRKI